MKQTVLSFFKRILIKDQEVYDARFYKFCQECDGHGAEDMFVKCAACEGKGLVRKTWSEYCECPV